MAVGPKKEGWAKLKNNYVYLGCMKVIFFLSPKITSREQKATAESRAETTCLDNISSRRLGKKGETFKKEEEGRESGVMTAGLLFRPPTKHRYLKHVRRQTSDKETPYQGGEKDQRFLVAVVGLGLEPASDLLALLAAAEAGAPTGFLRMPRRLSVGYSHRRERRWHWLGDNIDL